MAMIEAPPSLTPELLENASYTLEEEYLNFMAQRTPNLDRTLFNEIVTNIQTEQKERKEEKSDSSNNCSVNKKGLHVSFSACPVCFDAKPCVNLRSCDHSICEDCLRNYVKSNLKNIAKYPMKCYANCECSLNFRDVAAVLSKFDLKSFEKFSVMCAFPAASRDTCPRCEIVFFVEEPKIPAAKWVPDKKRPQCRRCQTEFRYINPFKPERRHHCRFCGEVFCNECSNFWILCHTLEDLCEEDEKSMEPDYEKDPSLLTRIVPPPIDSEVRPGGYTVDQEEDDGKERESNPLSPRDRHMTDPGYEVDEADLEDQAWFGSLFRRSNAPEPTKIYRKTSAATFANPERDAGIGKIRGCAACYAVFMRAVCPDCGFEFCSHCRMQWHPTYDCTLDSEAKRRDEEHQAESMRLIDSSGWRACPGCGMVISKDSGCNHMTHEKCPNPSEGSATHFCYKCGDLLQGNGHTHEMDGTLHFPDGVFSNCRKADQVKGSGVRDAFRVGGRQSTIRRSRAGSSQGRCVVL